ncbi:MAG: hypothetical protein WBV64_06010, partial [Mycobacterium sp.]
PEQRRQLLEPIEAALARADNHARVGLTVVPGELIASIICDGDGMGMQARPDDAEQPRIEVTEIGDTVWISVHQNLPDTAITVEEYTAIA